MECIKIMVSLKSLSKFADPSCANIILRSTELAVLSENCNPVPGGLRDVVPFLINQVLAVAL